MNMEVTGRDICGYCKQDIAAAAERAGLKSLTVRAPSPKTVYDPARFSNEQIIQWGQEAAVKGYEENFIKNRHKQYTENVNGIPFRVYINEETGAVNNVHLK